MTRLTAPLALLAVAALLGGCGKSNPSASTARHESVGSTAARASALSLAREVNLTAADVPGFVASSRKKEGESPHEKQLKAKLQACVHPVTRAPLAEASSPEFQREVGLTNESVQSEVTVASSRAAAAKELALARSRRTRACVSRYIGELVHSKTHPGSTFGSISLVQRIPPAPGADGSFAWRISVPVTAHGITLAIYFDIFGFVSNANEVTLFVTGLPIPPPAQVEARLYSLLLERTKAAEKGRPAPQQAAPNPHVTTS